VRGGLRAKPPGETAAFVHLEGGGPAAWACLRAGRASGRVARPMSRPSPLGCKSGRRVRLNPSLYLRRLCRRTDAEGEDAGQPT